jgi:Domain of unknown function (DUF4260)
MKTLTKLEELFLVFFSIYLFSRLPFAWWIFPLFFFAPDLSMIGLLAGKRAGAILYDVFHHKAIALSAYVMGNLLGIPPLSLIGVLMLGHSSFDQVCGFGLLDPNDSGQPSLMPIGWKA